MPGIRMGVIRYRKRKMRPLCSLAFVIISSGCEVSEGWVRDNLIGQDSFAVAARYGTPVSYRHEDDLLQLNYGSETSDCKIIMLVDEAQRVVGWVSTGARCAEPSGKSVVR